MWFLVALVLAALTIVSAPAGAQQSKLPVDVEVEAGFAGRFAPGRPVPVRIELSSGSLVSGELLVSTRGGPVEVIPFEITGGGTEQHWALLDTPLQDDVSLSVTVEVDNRRSDPATAALRWDSDALLVGVIDGSPLSVQPPRDVRTAVLDRELVFASLPPALLDLGPQALAALDAVAVTEQDLAALPTEHVGTIVGWLTTGGTLYVDMAPGAIPQLPEVMHPTAGFAQAGAARVVAADGALGAGRWADVVMAAPNRSIHEDGDVRNNLPQPDLMSEAFATDLGRDLPPLSRLLAIIGIYAVIVGPGARLVLRRRPMARWAALPALAVLATGVVYLSGDRGAEGMTVDVIDVIETGPAAQATSRLVVAADSGDRSVVTPAGWAAEQENQFDFGHGERIRQRRNADGVEMSVPAQAGGVAIMRASGPVDFDGALEVTARATGDGRIEGRVTNTTGVALESVAVFVGRSTSAEIGTLGPGEAADFDVSGADQFRFGADPFREAWPFGGFMPDGGIGLRVPSDVTTTMVGESLEVGPIAPGTVTVGPLPDEPVGESLEVSPIAPPELGPMIVSEECDQFGNCTQCDANGNCFGTGVAGPVMACDNFGNCFPAGGCRPGVPCEGVVRPGTLAAALWDRGTNAMAGSVVSAVGWTTELPPMIDLGSGVDVSGRRTALIGRTVPDAGAADLVDSATLRQLVSAGKTDDGLVEMVNRFDLPATVDGRPVDKARLRVDIPAFFAQAAILTPNGEYVIRDGVQAAGERTQATVPPEAIVDGHIFVRLALPFASPPPGRDVVVYEEVRR